MTDGGGDATRGGDGGAGLGGTAVVEVAAAELRRDVRHVFFALLGALPFAALSPSLSESESDSESESLSPSLLLSLESQPSSSSSSRTRRTAVPAAV